MLRLARLARLAEGWIAPPAVRERRELVRYRHRLVRQRSSCKTQVHGVMAKNGVLPTRVQMWGPGAQLSSTPWSCPMPTPCASSPCGT